MIFYVKVDGMWQISLNSPDSAQYSYHQLLDLSCMMFRSSGYLILANLFRLVAGQNVLAITLHLLGIFTIRHQKNKQQNKYENTLTFCFVHKLGDKYHIENNKNISFDVYSLQSFLHVSHELKPREDKQS